MGAIRMRARGFAALMFWGVVSTGIPTTAVWLVGATTARAQVSTGSLAGTVTDSTNAVVPAAAVVVSDDARGFVRTAVADRRGRFRLAGLPPGIYQVSVAAAGFRTALVESVAIRVGATTQVAVPLDLAASAERVEVTANGDDTTQFEPAEPGALFDRARIDSLPLNRRAFLQLAYLTPGVLAPAEKSELSSRGGVAIHANGARESFNNVLLDGIDNNDVYVNRYVVQPPVDSVEEFRVTANGYGAEYGRNAGAQVNVITRGGANVFHGGGAAYLRDRTLNTRNAFEASVSPYQRTQGSTWFGGPVVRRRTYVFAAVDHLRERATLSRAATVPTVQARAGDLSGPGGTVVNPFTGAAFAGNRIPSSQISPLARQVLAMFPAPNQDGVLNYLGQPIGREDSTNASVRLDHRIATGHRLMSRVSGGRMALFEPFTEGTGATAGYGSEVSDRTWNGMVHYAHVFPGSSVNTLRLGGNGFRRDVITENHLTNVGAAWGVNWLSVRPEFQGYPAVNVAGFTRVGDATSLPLLRNATTLHAAEDFSTVWGRHLLKAGAELRVNRLRSEIGLFTRGQLSFTGNFTGSGLGDLLLGLPSLGIQSQANNPIAMRTASGAAYVQDGWQVARLVTLQLGVRYEYATPPTDAVDGMTTLDVATGTLRQVGTGGITRSGVRADRNNIAPRVGVVATLPGTVVARAGYGRYYDIGTLDAHTAQYFNPPQFRINVYFPSARGLLSLENPFPTTSGYAPPATLSVLSPDLQTASMQHWYASTERTFRVAGTVALTYAGSRGAHLLRPINLNQAPAGSGSVQSRRPFPAYADIFYIESAGRSRYDSLQATYRKPMGRHVGVDLAYTLSASSDDASAFLGTPTDPNLPQDSAHPEREWAPSSFDARHRATASGAVFLPERWRWSRRTQVQVIWTASSGQPLTPLLRFDNSGTGNTGGSTAGSDRPNVVGPITLAHPSASQWFNTAAFVLPAPGTFGTAGRNSIRGPGYSSVDAALMRQFRFGRAGSMDVGVQAFNLLNRTNYDQPEGYADEPATFGRILSAKAPRQVQLVARVGF